MPTILPPRICWSLFLVTLLGTGPLCAADPASASLDPDLRIRLDDKHAEGTDVWIYNDIPAALAEAKRTGRPVFVTFRCVPCKACESFDAEVAHGSDVIADLAKQSFVAVRQVEMEGVDLNQFEFDYDLNWGGMFINADGTVYARYGTQSAAGPDAYNSIEGLRQTMLRVLELHKHYPGNAAELADKKGVPRKHQFAIDMPALVHKETFADITTRKNCIHCHMIHDAENRQAKAEGRPKEELFYRYPLPENIGLVIDAGNGVKIESVDPGSAAARAGLKPGEEVTHMNGQAITSIADMQWVLHHSPAGDTTVRVTGARSGEKTLSLAAGWKKHDFSWRGSMWSLSPNLAFWGQPVDDARRQTLGLTGKEPGLDVRMINKSMPGGRAAAAAGLQVGDVIVQLAGKPVPDVFKSFNKEIKEQYNAGDTVPLTVIRTDKRIEIEIKAAD